ncbi:right-handed parallel beta-helix repeat-containing protein [Streptomyces longispororuber]|uniref:right-handed parallel beta-helix repeat-containing protein n=1 Tax=Streptomyces longispororuber TaxID=68230 RepID=UPI00210B679B|nr:right-handed parallel beta-helix repeat-containing protein [Streptomyces longispororuber]MCQ4213321.1 right-handed parallel beta-helix repeat-containing protein [Streptomyces longispororuber]
MGIKRHGAPAAAALTLALLVVTGCTGTSDTPAKPKGSPSGSGAATAGAPASVATTAKVCAKPGPGPAKPPKGAVTVDPKVVNDLYTKTQKSPPNTTFWLKPGKHLLEKAQYAQVIPKKGDRYLGAPGAVLDGRKTNQYAFGGHASDVTISSLTVQGFVPPQDEGVVNHGSADGWVIEHSTIQYNSGAGLMTGARQQIRGNCLRGNGQYGINGYKEGDSIRGLVVEGNEIVGNNTDDWEKRRPGCGCTGGMKFWAVNGADIRGNWVHDNLGAGFWADTNNNDFLIENNLFENNNGAALIYEISYNAIIRNNTIRRNNWVEGRRSADRGDNFPFGTVYLSEAGGEPRIKARTDKIDVYRNVLENNWNGITLWESADRFCNSPANTSGSYCTLLVKDTARCKKPAIADPPLYDDCRWKTQRVDIHANRFLLDKSVVKCEDKCDRMAVLANYGTYPKWSPYKGLRVAQAITRKQHNRWHDNTYRGPWTFVVQDPSQALDRAQWQSTPYRQDAGSTFRSRDGG